MKTTGPTLAKSLHTHSVLVNVALHVAVSTTAIDVPLTRHKACARAAVDAALAILQLSDKDDPYALAERAREHVAAVLAREYPKP